MQQKVSLPSINTAMHLVLVPTEFNDNVLYIENRALLVLHARLCCGLGQAMHAAGPKSAGNVVSRTRSQDLFPVKGLKVTKLA